MRADEAFDFRDPRTQPLPDTDAFRAHLSSGWAPLPPQLDADEGARASAAAHRRRIRNMLPGCALVVGSGAPSVRSNDVLNAFRAHSDFVWLTGCDLPESVLVLLGADDGGATLYLPEPAGPGSSAFYADTKRGELWHGPMPTLAEWSERLGIQVRPAADLDDAWRTLPAGAVRAGADDERIPRAARRSREAEIALSAARRVKDDWELAQLREAVDATVVGFAAVVRELGAAVAFGGERWLQGTFERTARTLGNGVGYTSIVGAGANSPILHWKRCDGPVRGEDLLLIDAGVESRSLYTADVTRTLPVSGAFTEAQRAVYDRVLRAHRAAMAQVRPGKTFADMRSTAYELIATGLHELGILRVSVDEAMSANGQQHRRYLASGTGHHIGLDVHDCARVDATDYLHEPLAPGMILAVEPGMYFQTNDLTVPPELRGFGVRIEDDLLVTPEGHEVLSAALPIDPGDVEAWMVEVASAVSAPEADAALRNTSI